MKESIMEQFDENMLKIELEDCIDKSKTNATKKENNLFETTMKIEYESVEATGEEDPIKMFHCDRCSYSTIKKAYLTQHEFTHSPVKLFKCDACEKSFNSRGTLHKHKLSHKGFSCGICCQKFSAEGLLIEHLAKPDAHQMYQCKQCPFATVHKRDFSRHVYTHSPIKAFECDACQKSFKTRLILNRHKFVHRGFVFCSICRKNFPNEDVLNEHRATPGVHKIFRCEQCPYSTFHQASLSRHVYKHSPVKAFHCDACEKSFKTQHELSRHKIVHRGYVSCGVCSKMFSNEPSLNKHQMNHKMLQCDQCGYATMLKSSLIDHIRTHSPGKAFKCDSCEKSFKTQKILSKHKFVHKGLLSCSLCRKNFANKSLLNEHKAVPGIHKLFPCGQCSFATIYKASLIKHIRHHSPVRNPPSN